MIKKKIIKKITLVNTSLYNNSTTVLLQFESPLSALNLIFSIALSTYIQHAINITKQTISCILIIRFMYLTSFIFINFIEEFFRPPPCLLFGAAICARRDTVDLFMLLLKKKWSWRESNPRPVKASARGFSVLSKFGHRITHLIVLFNFY